MNALRFTLVSDGPSDRPLLPILTWLLIECGVQETIDPQWLDFRLLPNPPTSLSGRIDAALQLYACDILFVHRDAERGSVEERKKEIHEAVERCRHALPAVCVVPIRMTEAWLLFDTKAIRKAAGNPNGRENLNIPELRRLESLPDPKEILHQSLRDASGLTGRRLKKFNPKRMVYDVANFIDDFSPLRLLSAFQHLEQEVRETLNSNGWRS